MEQKILFYRVDNIDLIKLSIFACVSAYHTDMQEVSRTGKAKTVLLKKESKAERCFGLTEVQIACACYNAQARAMGSKELIIIPCLFQSDKLNDKLSLSGKKQSNFRFEIRLLQDALNDKDLEVLIVKDLPKSALRRQNNGKSQAEAVDKAVESLPTEQSAGQYEALRNELLKAIEQQAIAFLNPEASKLSKFLMACSTLLDKKIERYVDKNA